MRPNTLFGYAFLKVSFDSEKKNAVDLILPLSVRALATLQGPVVSAPDLQRAIREVWGLTIPENVLRYMLPKLGEQGYLTNANRIYTVNRAVLGRRDFENREKAAAAIYQRVLGGIKRLLVIYNEGRFNPDEVIEKFLDTGSAAFLSERALMPFSDPLDVLANVLVAEYTGMHDGNINMQALDDI